MSVTTLKNNTLKTWARLIQTMTTEEIEKRDLLVSLSPSTAENLQFRILLAKEYNRRKQLKLNL